MDNLWAPWRMTYILEEEKPPGCIFCKAVDGQGYDGLVLGVGQRVLAMMNKFPYNNGHLLMAPHRHVATLDQLDAKEKLDLMNAVERGVAALKAVMRPDGFNVGLNLGRVAGAGIEEHLHFHVVPRWNGDVNFMTVFADIRVIPEHIQASHAKLREYFADM